MDQELKEQFGTILQELSVLREDLRNTRHELRGDIVTLRHEVKAEIAGLRTEVKAEIAGLRSEMIEAHIEVMDKLGSVISEVRENRKRIEKIEDHLFIEEPKRR